MKYKQLFDGTQIPVLGLGTWKMGGQMEADTSQESLYINSIKTALELGYTHIDTAEMYGAGHTEELVGEAIKSADREKLFITTKVWKTNLAYQDVLTACEQSLKRLGTEYIDLYLIHATTPEMDLENTFKALNELVKNKKVKYLGVSNLLVEDIEKAQKFSETPIVTNQVHYNLKVREPEKNGVLDYCSKNNILITAYQPIERGNVLQLPLVRAMAKKYGKTPTQIAINWLLNNPNVITIPMATKKEHLQENLEALEFELSKEDVGELTNGR